MRMLTLLRCFPRNRITFWPRYYYRFASTHNMVDKSVTELAGSNDYHYLAGIFQELGENASENFNYFLRKQKNIHADYTKSFQSILNVLDPLQISLEVVANCCSKFDVSPTCKGNGYRSIINIVESCLTKVLKLSIKIQGSREKLFFRSYHLYMELESYTQVLMRLLTVTNLTIVMLDYSAVGNLFPDEKIVEDVMSDFEKINRECFYGRSFGFQYAESIRQSLQVVAVAMAAYGDGYIRHNRSFARALSSMLHSGKYVIDPELRAKRITELTQNADIEFCKAFWSLTEEHGVQHAPLLMCPAMAVNLEFTIPTNSLKIQTVDGKELNVKFPFLHSEQRGIKARLLSYVYREGQMFDSNTESSKTISPLGPKPSPKSRYLMIHCHGGGFVAQSSKSHEMYLRYWAKELKIPILSIDYSLAPDAPYPQALNEVYFAYIWALNNLHKLGTTAEKICFSGDSAGGNLVTGLSLKCIESNIRPADSVVVAYPPLRLQFLPTPSRILCLMDPLLPFGVLKSCIQAYGGTEMNTAEKRKKFSSFSDVGSSYNAYDLDFGCMESWDSYNRFKLDHTHSFSESNLNSIKKRLLVKHQVVEEDRESFYSEFPYSDTDDSLLVEDGNMSTNDAEEYISFHADELMRNEEPRDDARSLLDTFASQISSNVQNLKTGVTSFFSKQHVPDDKTPPPDTSLDDAVSDVVNIVRDDVDTLDGGDLHCKADSEVPDEPKKKKAFRICKECLHRSDNCLCQRNHKKWTDSHRKMNTHYKSSHHHRNNDFSRNRSKSYSSLYYMEHERSLRRCNSNYDVDETNDGSRNIPQRPKSLHIDGYLHHMSPDLSKRNLKSPPGSPRVLYDKYTESCEIQTTSDDCEQHQIAEDKILSKVFEEGKDPLMSPYLADDEMLKKLPPFVIVACALDPLFDDSVEFIKKLRKLDKRAELYVLNQLPHGFLNFQVFSSEARDGCDLIIACIKKSLEMGMRRQDSSTSFSSSLTNQQS